MRLYFLGALLSLSTTPAPALAAPCAMTPEERSWIDGAIRASNYVMEERLHLAHDRATIIAFNEKCRFELREGRSRWAGETHAGKIGIPNGGALDAGVIAMQDQDNKTGERFFVMSLPSIWIKAGIMTPGDPGLTAVFLHEFSHARQIPALNALFRAAAAQYHPPEYFNDDSLQGHFKSDPAYVAVYEKEAALLYRAAAEPDDVKARALAKQALDLMEARQKRWFTGTDAMWKIYDDLYLTMEGFAQWNAYAWMSDPRGGAMTAEVARERMRGAKRQWSQEEGFGLWLVIDRFVPDWAAQSFASPPKLGIDLLKQAVVDGRATPADAKASPST